MKRVSLVLVCLLLAFGTQVFAPAAPKRAPAKRTTTKSTKAKPAAKKPAQTSAKPTITAEQVLEKAVEAMGGREALDKIKTLLMRGSISVTGQGLNGVLEIQTKEPDKTLMTMQLAGMEIQQGFDGKDGWVKDFGGIRDLSSEELASLKQQSKFSTEANWKELYKKVELIGLKKLDSKSVYVLEVTPVTGPKSTNYYDAATFLPIRADTEINTPQANLTVTVTLSDWRDVSGMKAPYKMVMKMPFMELVMQMAEVKANIAIDDSVFARPSAK